MIEPKTFYRRIFEQFGHPLDEYAGMEEEAIAPLEKVLGIVLHQPLRDFYRVAGKLNYQTVNNVSYYLGSAQNINISGITARLDSTWTCWKS